jgi:MSHA biogenesis protein MshQ
LIFRLKQSTNRTNLFICKFFAGFIASIPSAAVLTLMMFSFNIAKAATTEFNSSGGTTSTNGLHFYIDSTTRLQVKRLDNTGQVYEPGSLPTSTYMDNGVFLRANGRIYGPSNFAFSPNGGFYNSAVISAVSPANPVVDGQQQVATSGFGINSGPQITVVWKYIVPFDFITAEVTLVIPNGYSVSTFNPVRYYHVIDTFLGGSDNGCGVKYTDSNGKLVVGTYPWSGGSSCPSSTGVPTGVNVVESFRERSGGAFPNYCASAWDDFWYGNTACSISKSGDLNNVISTNYQDTGVAIEYEFTSAGTYTFSYDFVVGSTKVPIYDHLEIRHPGTASLCPTDVVVLACTVSTVPCPSGSAINTGTLTGSIKNTPNAPAITKTPATFTLGASGNSDTVTLQGSGAGVFTLSATGLSATPLNGTKCWNTATNTASCIFTVTNTPCVSGFECLETSLSYNNLTSSPSSRNPLYTQVSGNGFKFDVVALQSNGSLASGYTATSGVTVELFDDSANPQPACTAYSSPIASQAITFSATDNGRKTLANSFIVNKAYRKLRCRVRDTNVAVTGCSSDDFSVRPANFIVTSSNAIADSGNTSAWRNENATPVFKAGTDVFSLTASTGTVGYDGTPQINSTYANVQDVFSWAYGAAPTIANNYLSPADYFDRVVGVISGSFSAANSTSGNATGNAFKYSEVGYVRFQVNAVYDDTFTAIDQSGDCVPGFNASGSKNACNIGSYNPADPDGRSPFFGRFIPDHFTLTSVSTEAGCSSSTPFTYYGQAGLNTTFKITAKNGFNQTTQNYTNNAANEGEYYAKFDLSNAASFNFSATGLPATTLLSSSIQSPVVDWIRGEATISALHTISRASTPTTPANITISAAPSELDGGKTIAAAVTNVSLPSLFRYGRLFVPNAYGSELLPLTSLIEAQYWNGTAYQKNQSDSCTYIPASSIAMGNYKKNLNACETRITNSGTFVNGALSTKLSAPGNGNSGSVDLAINLNAAAGTTCNSATPTSATSAAIPWFGTSNPSARATFGIYKSPVIYLRENF